MSSANATRAFETLIGREGAEAMWRRGMDRLQKAESPPAITLPVSKAEFPKVLCLDMMHWVALARAHNDTRNPTPEAIAALAAIRESTGKGRLVVPILAINLDEATESRDEGRRTRLARSMVELSGNFSVLNHAVVHGFEIERAVEKHFVGTTNLPPIRPRLIHWGLSAAGIGREVRVDIGDRFERAVLQQFAKEPEMSVASLVFAMDQETIEKMRQREASGIEVIEQAREADGHLPPAKRWSLAMLYVLKDGQGRDAEAVVKHLAARRIPPAAYVDVLVDAERRSRFIDDFVQLHIRTMIMYSRDQSSDDRAQPNDFKDGEFLGQAIAYGNIVATEKRWTHHAKKSGMAERYGTTVIASLKDLPSVLAAEGCL
jgi:hypothetical protein